MKELTRIATALENMREAIGWDHDLMVHCHWELDLSSSILSVALIDTDFKDYFQLTNTDRGMVSSAFFWSYALLQIPAGWIVDRFGSKYPMAISFTVWRLLTPATALTAGFASLFAVRLLLGLGEAVMHSASMRWIRFNFPETQRGFAIGVFMSGSKFGPAIGAVAAAWLIESHGWQTMFIVLGLGSLVWLLPWLLLVKNDRGVQTVSRIARVHHVGRRAAPAPSQGSDQ